MSYRRRNPDSTINTVLVLGALGVGGYLLYTLLAPLFKGAATVATAVGQGANVAANTVASPIASAISAVTLPPPITLTHSVVLDNGNEVPLAAVGNISPSTLADGTPSGTFSYQGTQYQLLGPADDTGTYYAISSGG